MQTRDKIWIHKPFFVVFFFVSFRSSNVSQVFAKDIIFCKLIFLRRCELFRHIITIHFGTVFRAEAISYLVRIFMFWQSSSTQQTHSYNKCYVCLTFVFLIFNIFKIYIFMKTDSQPNTSRIIANTFCFKVIRNLLHWKFEI